MSRHIYRHLLIILIGLFNGPALALGRSTAVQARKGGVSLRLEVSSRTLKAGDPLFVRLTLRNVAPRGELVISDWKYRGGNPAELESAWMAASEQLGIDTIEVLGPDGKLLVAERYAFSNIRQTVAPWEVTVSSADAEIVAYAKSLRDSGHSPAEVTERLNQRQRRLEEAARDKRNPVIVLASGKAAHTVSFCTRASCPGDGYVELPYVFAAPGQYKVRALYEHAPEKRGRGDAWDVDLATTWAEFEVKP